MLRAITFDGGGMRGLISLVLLERLLHHRSGLLDEADLLAGTSAGGLTALSLAAGQPVGQIRALYRFHGKEIFARNRWTPLGLFGARYRNAAFYKLVSGVLGTKTLGQLDKKVLVPTFDLRRGGAKFFTNWEPNDVDCEVQAREVAMATSAAPTYFPTWEVFADGGLAANNPAAAAMALMLNPDKTRHPATPIDVRLLSLGTGHCPQSIKSKNRRWGMLQWGRHLVNVFMDGLEGVPNYLCRSVLRSNFYRVQPIVSPLPALDDYRKVDELIRIGEQFDLQPAIEWIDSCWSSQ
jgi:patatin-like phospholipase/acyl hydrolase